MHLLIDSFGAKITKRQESLYLVDDENDGVELEISLAEGLLVTGKIGISSDALIALLQADVPTFFVSRNGAFIGKLAGPSAHRLPRLEAQVRCRNSPASCLALAKILVAAKLSNQWLFLDAIRRNRRDFPKPEPRPTLDFVQDAATLLGVEGAAASAYWSQIGHVIPPEWEFQARTGRHATDPMNALLNYLYAVLEAWAVRGCHLAGLVPEGGVLHTDRPGRNSLALDLMEPFRPVLVDRVVVRMVSQGLISPADAEKDEDGCIRLSEKARKIAVAEFYRQIAKPCSLRVYDEATTFGAAVNAQAECLARHLVSGHPFTAADFREGRRG